MGSDSMNAPWRIAGAAIICKVTLLVSLSGCGSVPGGVVEDALVPVAGVIKLGGEPVENAQVTFTPTTKNGTAHTGSGFTDTSGEFDMLNYRHKRGLPPGTYIVTVSLLPSAREPLPGLEDRPPQFVSNQAIPKEWSDPTKAGRHNTVTVPDDGRTDFEFKIPKKS